VRILLPGRYLAFVLLAAALSRAVGAQDILLGAEPVRSYSGQFIVHAQSSSPLAPWATSLLATNRALLQLDPALVAISGERIKQNLLRQLGIGSPWRGRIYVEVRPARFAGQNVTITSKRFNNVWQYQVELPDPVARERYVRAIVQVLLLELANRESADRLAEVPFWLAEGLAQQLLASNEIEIILEPPRAVINGLNVSLTRVVERRDNPLNEARARLGARQPLSFDELSWPAKDAASGDPGDVYSASAQMFVAELLRLKDGKACLQTMVMQLPQFYNWQFAFLRAFQGYFARPLDVEKWWALSLASSTGRDTARMWPAEESWRKLDELLPTVLQIRAGTNAPSRETWTLQGIIREWPLDRQAQALTAKLLELETLRAHAAQDVVMLVHEYCQALSAYLRNEHKVAPISRFGKPTGLGRAAEDAIQRLDTLDARRQALRPPQMPVADGHSPHLPTPSP
jgi:hypothetical protein